MASFPSQSSVSRSTNIRSERNTKIDMAAPVPVAVNEENWFTKTGQYLISDQHFFGKSINKVAEMSGQKNTNVLLGVIFLASMVFIMSEEPKPQMLCHVICITYLTQRTVVALIFGANDEISKWLFCWVWLSPFYLI
uniref:Uncharacterized protein n=1 Tax=Romanomermis culicivorax TaxID=13658 RepID=A0A915IMP1_ROMCU